MVKLTVLSVLLALGATASAQCGANNPPVQVTGSSGNYRATQNGNQIYSGGDYRLAIQTALDRASSGQRVAVFASGSIGANTILVGSGKILEVCGTLNVGNRSGRGAIESTDTQNAEIRYLTMTGNPYFGLRFFGTRGLRLGELNLNLSGGMGIRFERDKAANSDVKMGIIRVTGAGSHAVETWNINGLEIDQVIARNVGECGLLLQKVTNARVNLVDGDNVAAGNGYATLRFANENGKLNGGYPTNVYINRVKSRGGGRGIFCVSQSGGAQIDNIDLANNGNNAILIENCYNVNIRGGTINGGGEVRLAARTEFANSRDITITAQVNNNSVRESPCADNSNFYISGNARMNVC
ncbi:hypothetical protein BJ508DRAFT_327280 [Ascobolus immersus RN42]|uniref:Parallel beta-helix repeat protein n=1 Tax=Ascobolus immersus RN42 TaxID=1160509 RepID=A0A3N4I7A0_ASCIM|nr:hypothetical protein BJ508DRAFT_327280 [Ascobolus immersus RN42]